MPKDQLLDDPIAFFRIAHDGFLIDDPVIRDGDLFGVLFRRCVPWNDRVVESVHSHGYRTAALHVRFFK